MEKNYNRNSYGELRPAQRDYEIWVRATGLITQAVAAKKIPCAYDDIAFDRKLRASGSATHHEIYDIHPDPLRVLVCIRETEGTKYGVKTLSKTYYIVKQHGRGTRVVEANKAKSAKAAKAAGCELGCAINVVEGRAKLKIAGACPDGIAYKQLAIDDDGQLFSVYDGSPWEIGVERFDRAMRNHNGGLYVYETAEQAQQAPFPGDSELLNHQRVIVRCRVAGNYCRYGDKLAFSRVTPLEII